MSPSSGIYLLHKLAQLYGVQTAYYDVTHRRCPASPETLLAMLKALGAPVETFNDIESALHLRRQEMWQRIVEPVTVVWHGNPVVIEVRLPDTIADAVLVGHLTLEEGGQWTYRWPGADSKVKTSVEVEGVNYLVKQLTLPDVLPLGYHRFTLQVKGKTAETLIIVAPVKAYNPVENFRGRKWGVFIPLYALGNDNSVQSGSYSNLERLIEWVSGLGGSIVATLPLLPAFLDEPFEPSPYAPISRLFWNEFYLDITRIPELQKCSSAQALFDSVDFSRESGIPSSSRYVDYRPEMALKRHVLEELCQSLFAENSDKLKALDKFARENPLLEEYARFRAILEQRRTSWQSWPHRLRDGVLEDGDYKEKDRQYHLYAQWLAHQQVEALHQKAREKGVALYLDLPLGVHRNGFDAWYHRNIFTLDASAGAPPDAVFTKGQDWSLPPLHPDRIRELGYRYPIAYLRHHFRYAGILRIDHIMGLHRLYCIPKGLPASQGVYIRYHPEELYAILTLESHRHGTIIIGEDLGTVPREVRPAMTRHGINRTYVVHYELETNLQKGLKPVSSNYIVSLNNHDMPTFAGFWQGLDIKQQLELGFKDIATVRREQKIRDKLKKDLVNFLLDKGWLSEPATDAYVIMRACLAFLSSTRAYAVLVNLEDLWLESEPQNIPGSGDNYPNWRRKAKYRLDEFCQMPKVLDILHEIDGLRKLDNYSHQFKKKEQTIMPKLEHKT